METQGSEFSERESRQVDAMPWNERTQEDKIQWLAKGYQYPRKILPGYFVKDKVPTKEAQEGAAKALETYDRSVNYFLSAFRSIPLVHMVDNFDNEITLDVPDGTNFSVSLDGLYFLLGKTEEELLQILNDSNKRKYEAPDGTKKFLPKFKPGGQQLLSNELEKSIAIYVREKVGSYTLYRQINLVNPSPRSAPQQSYIVDERGFIVTDIPRKRNDE